MVALIRKLTNLPPPTGGYDKLPKREETTPAADLARIKYYSNMFLKDDIRDREIESAFFTTVWRDITGAIGRLGGPEMIMECEELKTKYVNHTRYQQSYIKGVDKQPALSATVPSLERLTSFQHEGKVKDSQTVFPYKELLDLSISSPSPQILIGPPSRKISNLDHQKILNDSSSEEDLHGSGLFSPLVSQAKVRSLKPSSLLTSAYFPADGDINEDKEIVSSGLDSFDEKEKEKYALTVLEKGVKITFLLLCINCLFFTNFEGVKFKILIVWII
ncbi:uncharacterized protein LOC127719302 [Mytilus californianus]|uniref:uncharacterized protein LOC127719302 n=1 Tax=Mytilus californianus TaxID=6549 RepID=UPI0022457B82|nr:uncharacterized protein LOC127719302 [Mytilus californianus]